MTNEEFILKLMEQNDKLIGQLSKQTEVLQGLQKTQKEIVKVMELLANPTLVIKAGALDKDSNKP